MSGKMKFFGLFICCLLLSVRVFATHNRAGEITYQHIQDLTYEFTITTYTDPTSLADRDELTILWGDGTEEILGRTSISLLVPGKIQKNEYVGQHTYGGAGSYEVSMVDPNRVENILNIDGSVNVPFCLIDTITIFDPLLYGYNSSPILLYPPIDYANIGEWFIHNPGAYDVDGDSLTYELVVPYQYPGLVVPGYQYPDDRTTCTDTDAFTINLFNGDVIWDVPSCQEGIYNIAILIREFRDGIQMSSILRDMQIFVEKTSNHAPEIAELNDTCVYAGEELNILVTATDPDVTQTITLTATGGPLYIDESPADFFSTPNEAFVEGTFTWQTVCNHIRSDVYSVVFKAEDDFQLGFEEIPLVDLETWLITVVAPPPVILDAVPTANEITITWQDPYVCAGADNFLGFSIWRKIGCDTTQFDKCQQGLEGTGYSKIGFVEDAYVFVDLAVDYGQEYAYRVQAEFGERSELAPDFVYNEVASAPSEAVCAALKRDLPIINHASVRETSTDNGSVYVGWYKPLGTDLDTTIFLPPYKYEVLRFDGFTPVGTPTTIATFTAPTFAELTDTAYIDTLINTEDGPFNYQLNFYFTDGAAFESLGKTDPASTVYLTVAPGDNKLNLSWNFEVPWLNIHYDIYKETFAGSGVFDSLTTTTETTYIDSNLVNGTQYCYYIKAYGVYTVATLPDTLINLSQQQCGVPIDNEAPCPPVLAVTNICGADENVVVDEADLVNDLVWTNPNNSCADDVVSYIIYYAAQDGQQLVVLDNVTNPNDTTFTHENLVSLAGCYGIVAVDSFGNTSPLSNIVCVDNCSDYDLPNAFTPNGDGFNDIYTPRLPIRFIDHVDMKIFDRWGNIVFTTTDPMINWDGKDATTGVDVSEGVYFYSCSVFEITVTGITPFLEPKEGYIHLIRQDKSE
jgi:gliding motility-associated-like protein